MNECKLYIRNENDLKGLSSSVIKAAKENAIKENHPDQWLFKTTEYLQIMKYLEKEEYRKEMYDLYNTIGRGGEYDNTENIKKITALQDE